MAKEFKRIDKYLVVKLDDLEKYTLEIDWTEIWRIVKIVEDGRKKEGKKENRYVVVNEDEEYAGIVWKLIEMVEKIKKDGYGPT